MLVPRSRQRAVEIAAQHRDAEQHADDEIREASRREHVEAPVVDGCVLRCEAERLQQPHAERDREHRRRRRRPKRAQQHDCEHREERVEERLDGDAPARAVAAEMNGTVREPALSSAACAATSVIRVCTPTPLHTGLPKYTMVRIIGGMVTRWSGTMRATRAA